MAKPETSSSKDAASRPKSEIEPGFKRRKRGYRGYPNNPKSGDVHWGSGFTGIGTIRGPSGSSGILTERTRDDAARQKEEDEDTLVGDA
jgi:hypothetical protein